MNSESERTKLTHNLRNHLDNIALNAEFATLELVIPASPDNIDPANRPTLECIDAMLCACKASAAIVDNLSILISDDS